MNIFIIIFGCLLISVIIYFVFSSKKTHHNQGNCQPDLKSCSMWKKVSTAYIPCIEGQSQKCGPNGQGCEDTEICTPSGCCVQCQSPEDLPNSATQTCEPDNSGCILQPDGESGFTTYVCTCTDAVTNPPSATCTNFKASYIQKNTGDRIPITNLQQSVINKICGSGTFQVPANWANTIDDYNKPTTLSRKCDSDPVKNTEIKYSNFTCPSGLQTDQINYECTENPSNICVPATRDQCEVTTPDYPCNPGETPSVDYCPDGTLNCIQKYDNGEFKGYRKCINYNGEWVKDTQCTACCDIMSGYIRNTGSGPMCIGGCSPPYQPHRYNDVDYCIFNDPINWSGTWSHDFSDLNNTCITPYQNCYCNTEGCTNGPEGTGGACTGPFPPQPDKIVHYTFMDQNDGTQWCWEQGNIRNNTWYCAPTGPAPSGPPYNTTATWVKCTNPNGCPINTGWAYDVEGGPVQQSNDKGYNPPLKGCSLADLDKILASQAT